MTSLAPERPDSLIRRLLRHNALHHAIRVMRVQQIVRGLLTRLPIVRRLPGNGIRYRLQHLESFVMADEIFAARCYGPAFNGPPIRSFIDVGCNVGYFVCFAAEATGNRGIVGLAVDGSGEMARETRWHVDANDLKRVKVLEGVAGFAPEVREVTFFVSASNVASSAQPRANPRVPVKGKTVEKRVPTVQLLEAWQSHAGDAPVDLLKIDVEGSELELIRHNAPLLAITRSIVIEWHRWVVQRSDVEAALAPHGFRLEQVMSEDADAGVGYFVRDAR
jgi:FkbM family methyltransferase